MHRSALLADTPRSTTAVAGALDAVISSASIGENAAEIGRRTLARMQAHPSPPPAFEPLT